MISDNARAGMQQAPARSLFNALGFTQEELKKPMVGIVSSYNEIVPGHMNIDKIVDAVKLGVVFRLRVVLGCGGDQPRAFRRRSGRLLVVDRVVFFHVSPPPFALSLAQKGKMQTFFLRKRKRTV